jgi:hypothetical protein
VLVESLSSPFCSPCGGILGFCWLAGAFEELIRQKKREIFPFCSPYGGNMEKRAHLTRKIDASRHVVKSTKS